MVLFFKPKIEIDIYRKLVFFYIQIKIDINIYIILYLYIIPTINNSMECIQEKYNIFYKLLHEHKNRQNKLLLKFDINNNVITFNIIKTHMNKLNFTDKDISNLQFILTKKYW